MAADEFSSMSATLRFPFQASLDGTSMVETDGNCYYGLDTAHAISELPVPVESERIAVEAASEEMQEQQPYKLDLPVAFHSPQWDTDSLLLKDEEPNVATTSRPVSMMPHRIDTSDQQRFAIDHEMTAEETNETGATEADQIYCESPTSTIESIETIEPTEPPATQIPARGGAPPRFYSTPIVKDDPNSTPVLLYGLEQPTDLKLRPRKLVSTLRPRSYYSAGPVRPSSRHGPSPLSSSMEPGIPEDTESSTTSRRLSVLFRRSSTYLPNKVAELAVGSTYSSGSASTTSTVRSVATAATEDSNYASNSTTPASSTSSSPTLNAVAPPEQKPPSNASSPSLVRANTTTTLGDDDDNQPDVSATLPPSSPPRPIRRKTTSTLDTISDDASSSAFSGETSRRTSIFNFSFRNFSPIANRSFMRSSETLSTIRGTREGGSNNPYTNTDFPLIRAPSKPMPYSPDSFISPHTEAGRGRARYRTAPFSDNDTTNDNDNYNNTTNDNEINPPSTTPTRPHTSYNPAVASSSSSTPAPSPNFSKPRIRTFSISRKFAPSETLPQPQPQSQYKQKAQGEQTGKPKNAAAAAAHRATKFLTRVFA